MMLFQFQYGLNVGEMSLRICASFSLRKGEVRVGLSFLFCAEMVLLH